MDNNDMNESSNDSFHFNLNGDENSKSLNNNQELNLNNQMLPNQNNNSSNFSHYGSLNKGKMPGINPIQNNNGLSTGKKNNDNKDNINDSNINNNFKKNNVNTNVDNKDSSNSNKEKSKNEDNKKDNNKDNKKSKDEDNKKGLNKKDAFKKVGSTIGKGIKSGTRGLNNLGSEEDDNTSDSDNSDDYHVASTIGNAAVSTAGTLKKVILLLIKHPWIAIIAGIIILVLFLLILFAVAVGGIFGGLKFAGWYCNMYSPTTSDNPGVVTSFYGWRIWNGIEDNHKGIDISYEEKGAEVLATHDGIVVETNYTLSDVNSEAYGIYITIEDQEETDENTKYRTYYAHLCSLEEEKQLKSACEAGNYSREDNNCIQNEDGTFSYKWSCGDNEQNFQDLINKLTLGSTIKKNDVIGYVSDTGYRSSEGDYHLHYETLEDVLNDDPDKGFVAKSPNRFFGIENSTLGCDPVLSVDENAPTSAKILKWECEKPIVIDDVNDQLVNYCDEDDPITPVEYRFKGTLGERNEDGNLTSSYDGIGLYTSNLCDYDVNPSYYGTDAQCAAGVHDYFKSFLKDSDSEAWSKFQSIKGNARDYWINNSNLGTNGFKTSKEPSAGSIWVSDYSSAKDSNGVSYGHVMVVTGVSGDNVSVYECNNKSKNNGKCGYNTYTKSQLEDWRGFRGYINVISCDDASS